MNITTYDEVPEELIIRAAAILESIPGDPSAGPNTQHWDHTPRRLARYLTHLGRKGDYDRWTTFPIEGSRPMVVVPNIPFWAACSHHLLPFVGTISVGYVPHHNIIGLSKIPILVRQMAHGFWVQEELAKSIAKQFDTIVQPLGFAVLIRAQHTCQLIDVGPPIPWMVTTEMHGVMLHNPSAKQEFLEACRDN